MTITWSLNPLLKDTLPPKAIIHVVEDIDYCRRSWLIFVFVAVIYPVVHRILMNIKVYRQLESESKQVVVLHHSVEAIILTVGTPFFVYLMVFTNFIEQNEDTAAAILSSFCMVFLFVCMYLIELSARYKNPRGMLVFHHVLTALIGWFCLLYPSTITMKTGLILVFFICFESLTFVGLFMYRMAPLHPLTPHIIMSGLVLFGVTRPIQVLWVCAAIFGNWHDEHVVKWQGILMLFLTCLLTTIQVWSMTINYGVFKRSVSKIKRSKSADAGAKHVNKMIGDTLTTIDITTRTLELTSSVTTGVTSRTTLDLEDGLLDDPTSERSLELDDPSMPLEIAEPAIAHETDDDVEEDYSFKAFLGFLNGQGSTTQHDTKNGTGKPENEDNARDNKAGVIFWSLILAGLVAGIFTLVMRPMDTFEIGWEPNVVFT